MKWSILNLILLLLFVSCNKEEVGRTTHRSADSLDSRKDYQFEECAQSTAVKPEVDFLFIWDNSTSTNFINDQTKSALNNTITYVAERFNYHILLAPLLTTSGVNQGASLFANQPEGLSSSALNMLLPADSNSKFSAIAGVIPESGSKELGFKRAYDLINSNISNGIFRSRSSLIVVLLSNEDSDVDYPGDLVPGHKDEEDFVTNLNRLRGLKSTLQSTTLRFITLVPFQNGCQSYAKAGLRYKRMSRQLYQDSGAVDQSYRSPNEDSYDICGRDFSNIFDSINKTINDVILSHVYQYWPVSRDRTLSFDPSRITVTKLKANGTRETISESNSDGWAYRGYGNYDLRIEPTAGESFTGHVVELNGSARLTYPDCMEVKTQSPAEYYGYIVYDKFEPDLSTVVIKKNGETIPQGGTNGWEYIGHRDSINIRITGPGNYSAKTPEVLRSGYVFKLNGAAIMTNDDSADVFAQPKVQ